MATKPMRRINIIDDNRYDPDPGPCRYAWLKNRGSW